jgi:hypothetical protein
MAFNPFHRFRKHQKVIFAVMAIVCMFVFVLQFAAGRGDPLQRLMDWFGARRNQGEVVTTLYSKKVYQGDLERLSFDRQMANEFIMEVVVRAQIFGSEEVQKTLANLDPAQKAVIDSVQRDQNRRRQSDQVRMNPQMARLSLPPMSEEEINQTMAFDAGNLVQLQKTLESNQKEEQARAVGSLLAGIRFEAWQREPGRTRDQLYMGGTRKTEDLLDFLVWKHQADRLGIVLTEADVRKAINQEAGETVLAGESFRDDPLTRAFLGNRNYGRAAVTDAQLVQALTDEYRVAFAKEAILGKGDGARAYRDLGEPEEVHQVPTLVTPADFLKYFRKERTTLNVALLPVPVSHFLDQVKGEPSEQDLKDLYDRYKTQEPSPERDRPGFKEPRRVRVAYVTAKPDSTFYKDMAARVATLSRPMMALGATANSFAGGVDLASRATAIAAPLTLDLAVLEQYETFRNEERFQMSMGFGVTPAIADPTQRALAEASRALGLGSALDGPLAVVMGKAGAEALYRQSVARKASAAVLAALSPAPLGAAAIPLPFAYAPLPLEALKPSLEERARTSLAAKLLQDNLKAFAEELVKLKTKPDEVAKYVEKAVKDFGLEEHAMTDSRTVYTIAEDPALKPFKEAFDRANAIELPGRPKPDFAKMFFEAQGTYDPMAWAAAGGFLGKTSDPLFWFFVPKEPILFWRTEDKAPRERTFADARADVVKAWRTEQARRLARKEAERIQKELKTRGSPVDAVNFLREQNLGSEVFELTGVAHLVKPTHEVLFGQARQYRPYQPPEDKIRYPRDTFVDQLLNMKSKGDSVVLRDKPEANFYVAVLLDRSEPSIKEFYEVYHDFRLDPLWQRMEAQAHQDYKKMVLEQLRTEAGPVHEAGAQAGRFVVNDAARMRGDSGESE